MKNHTGRLLLPLSFLLPACAETTLREGLWELSYLDVKLKNRRAVDPAEKDFPLPTRLLKLQLEEGEEEGTEMAAFDFVQEPEEPAGEEASPEGRPEAPVAPEMDTVDPMFADIRRTIEEKPPTIHIEAGDGTWTWRMFGVITAPEEILGHRFEALLRANSNVTLQGGWRMRWLGEE